MVVEFASGFVLLAYPVNPVLFLGTLLCKAMGEAMYRSRVRGVVGHFDRVGVMFVYVLPDVGTRGRVGMFLLGDQYDFAPAKV